MAREQRHRSESDADSSADSSFHPDADSYSDANADKYARATDCHPGADEYTPCGDTHADKNARAADRYPNADAYTDQDTRANPNAQKVDADAHSVAGIQKT